MRKIVILGSYKPSTGGLSEYSHHMVEALKEEGGEIHVVCDVVEGRLGSYIEDGVFVHRVWSYNNPLSYLKIFAKIWQIRPGLVWTNLIFTLFADKKVPAFLSLLIPFVVRCMGFRSVVTLHHVFEHCSADETKFGAFKWYDKLGAYLATRFILLAHEVVTTSDKYTDVLRGKYRAKNVATLPHGFIGQKGARPAPLNNYNILIFGKFGSYKKVEPAIALVKELRKRYPRCTLTIAGTNHPSYPGYLEGLQEIHKNEDWIKFTGYVAEEDLQSLFHSTCLLLLPYSSNTGVSGVAHLACSYGLPIVATDLPDMLDMAHKENMQVAYFNFDRPWSGVRAIEQLFENPHRLIAQGRRNFEISQESSFDDHIVNYANAKLAL